MQTTEKTSKTLVELQKLEVECARECDYHEEHTEESATAMQGPGKPVSWNVLFQSMGPSAPSVDIPHSLHRLSAQAKKRASIAAKESTTDFAPYMRINVDSHYNVCASRSDEILIGSETILRLAGLRDRWIVEFPDLEVETVSLPACRKPPGQGSNEPEFAPFNAQVPPKMDGYIICLRGVVGVSGLSDVTPMDCQPKPLACMREVSEASNSGHALVAPTMSSGSNASHNRAVQFLVDCDSSNTLCAIPTVEEFLNDLKEIMEAVQNPICKTFSWQRLRYLETIFNMHLMFNTQAEQEAAKETIHRDFYNVRKVDTHIHHSACMNQKHLLRFIRKKYKTESEVLVAKVDGKDLTLREVFIRDVGFTAYEVSTDNLAVQALGSCFQRFDLFNDKYNPFEKKLLREVFLKSDNYMKGRYLAEITREVMDDLIDHKYQMVEWRVSIYGRNREEWASLASWMVDNNLHCNNVRWMIQVPRLYHVYKRNGAVENFGDVLKNIFEPLFEALLDPEKHKNIFFALQQIIGWDSVDDESQMSKFTTEGGDLPDPEEWDSPNNPPYSYWMYYMHANIRSLNGLLGLRRMRAHQFRPHSGEAGSISHLASTFLLADSINHGIQLKKSPVLMYLFYLHKIGLAVSPLSNNALFEEIQKNPFPVFFKVGMNASLSTDDPLMFHYTDEPLLEEYSIAAHTWRMSSVDLCEIAAMSVKQSGFEPQFKRHWLGPNHKKEGVAGNSPVHSNVPNIRVQFRYDTYNHELKFLSDVIRYRLDPQKKKDAENELKYLLSKERKTQDDINVCGKSTSPDRFVTERTPRSNYSVAVDSRSVTPLISEALEL